MLEALQPADQTTGFEHEDTARLTIDRSPEPEPATYVNDRQVEPGKRRAVKHAGSRGPLFKALPSTPVLLGIAALAVSIGGVLTVSDQEPVSAAAGGLTNASALSGSSSIGKVVGERGDVVSRDTDRTAKATPPARTWSIRSPISPSSARAPSRTSRPRPRSRPRRSSSTSGSTPSPASS